MQHHVRAEDAGEAKSADGGGGGEGHQEEEGEEGEMAHDVGNVTKAESAVGSLNGMRTATFRLQVGARARRGREPRGERSQQVPTQRRFKNKTRS